MIWHIGNTTIRSPYKLRDALIVIHNSSLNGNMIGVTQENCFAVALYNNQILQSKRIELQKYASDLGRKWRSALYTLGFITPQLTNGKISGNIDPKLTPFVENIDSLSGRAYEITPNGYNLINAKSYLEQQKCLLAALVNYKIPSIIETKFQPSKAFYPLRLLLQILYNIEDNGEMPYISLKEFMIFVQTSSPNHNATKIANQIISFRKNRELAKNNKLAYDKSFYNQVINKFGCKMETLKYYAIISFNYLKAIGIFSKVEHGIAIDQDKLATAYAICYKKKYLSNDKKYLISLWNGNIIS